ncbi:MAG: hypothetical protein AB7K67_06170 [Hyphomicrobiaceae bacterium]
MVFLFKLMVPPLLVAGMSLAARRWGPTFGGLIMGLPWMTGPVLLFLALDKGIPFTLGACIGIEFGVVALGGYILAYAFVSRHAPWYLTLPPAAAAFFAIGVLIKDIAVPLWAAALAALCTLALVFVLLPRPASRTGPRALPSWDIYARMAATFCLVAVIMLSADVLGPRMSGIVSTFPVVLTVIGTFTHHQWGADAVLSILRGIVLSLGSFVAFFFVLGSVIPYAGVAGAFLLATVTAVTMSAMLLIWNRMRSR